MVDPVRTPETLTTTPERYNLDLDPDTFRRLAMQAVDLITDKLRAIQNHQEPTRRVIPTEVQDRLINQPVPEMGTSPDALIERFATDVLPYPLGNINTAFFAWVNSPPAPIGIIAEFLAAALDSSVTTPGQSAYYVENAVLNWMKQIMGYSTDAGAILVSGGSMANVVCLAAMRQKMVSGNVRTDGFYQQSAPLTVYTSTQGHSCIQKGLELLGFGSANLRKIPVDGDYRMDLAALKAQIAQDRADGMRPICIAASAGTVNTGAIDPLNEIADLCAEYDLWFHIDGAFGGLGILADSTTGLYYGIERADSIAIDQHKWLYVPIECGCALVKDKTLLRNTFSLVPAYLRDDNVDPWLSEFTPQQTRGFRALKLWMQIQQIGLDGYRVLIDRDIQLARLLQAKIEAHPDFQLVASGPLSVNCFRYAPAHVPESELEALNRRLLSEVQREGEVFITASELNGVYVMRACIVNFRMTERDLDALLDAFVRAASRLV